MITEYKRPETLQEALKLLKLPGTRPLGGGTDLSRRQDGYIIAVDLQALGLDQVTRLGEKLEIGATATLSQLFDSVDVHPALRAAIKLEAPLNLRNMGTVAGTLVVCDGHSPFAAALLALDAHLVVEFVSSDTYSLGDFLPMREALQPGRLITKIEIPLNVRFAFESIARTPSDRPVVCVALAQWPSGRTRLALAGWGKAPLLALDGNEPGGVGPSASNAYSEAVDEWASAEYRREMAAVLAVRALEKLTQ
jgi:CO/xanthine dehydrogenase FAD-binding subunit